MEHQLLQKALGMTGLNASEHQVELVVEFYNLLKAKGDNATLGEVEALGKKVAQRQQMKPKLAIQ